MTKNAMEQMETGGMVMIAKKDVYMRRRFWAITLFLSIFVMVISLVVFYLTGKPNNMEDSIAYDVTFTAKAVILQFATFGAILMWFDPPPPHEDSLPVTSPAQRAAFELAIVVLLCIVTLVSGKMVEVFFYTMSFIIGSIAIYHLLHDDHDDDIDMMVNHLSFIISLGLLTGLVCFIPNLFFFLGWLSIFILTYVYIVSFNFPDKTTVEVLAMISEDLNLS